MTFGHGLCRSILGKQTQETRSNSLLSLKYSRIYRAARTCSSHSITSCPATPSTRIRINLETRTLFCVRMFLGRHVMFQSVLPTRMQIRYLWIRHWKILVSLGYHTAHRSSAHSIGILTNVVWSWITAMWSYRSEKHDPAFLKVCVSAVHTNAIALPFQICPFWRPSSKVCVFG